MTADVTRAHHHGDPMSRAAHDSLPDKARMLALVVDAIRQMGGATCDEVEIRSGLSHQTASARVTEAAAKGLIQRTGEIRPTRSGRGAAVWTVTGDPCKGCGEKTHHRSGYCSSICYGQDNE